MSVQEFRKKPPTVQAFLVDGTESNARRASAWCGGSMSNTYWKSDDPNFSREGDWVVHVPECAGHRGIARGGDYIINQGLGQFTIRRQPSFESEWEISS